MTGETRAPEPEVPDGDSGAESPTPATESSTAPREIGGRKKGLDPTRYGDWEKNGRCIDF
ncbi:MAG: DUF1674 domain-containing protein [Wenzhouxiangella sp.]|jgi:hypothetical protein|nr:DUF1674 domain-containing protein [Wenzhouxiangella sp.]